MPQEPYLMKVRSIISNTISEEDLATGHLSIRFMSDGFSLLLESSDFKPIILNRFSNESIMPVSLLLQSAEDWLKRHTLLERFKGEVTIVTDSAPATVVPENLLSEEDLLLYLDPVAPIHPEGHVYQRKIKNRDVCVVASTPPHFLGFSKKFSVNARIYSPMEIMFSMSDQINAADHQRGFCLLEVQQGYLGILMIRNDEIVIANQQKIRKPDEVIYHTLNAIKQLDFDRLERPLYWSGDLMKEQRRELKKYIRNVVKLPYTIKDLEGKKVQEHILLTEATRCA